MQKVNITYFHRIHVFFFLNSIKYIHRSAKINPQHDKAGAQLSIMKIKKNEWKKVANKKKKKIKFYTRVRMISIEGL